MSSRSVGQLLAVAGIVAASSGCVSMRAAPQRPTEPDFSGRWALVTADGTPTDIPVALIVHQTIQRTNIRGEPMPPYFKELIVEREYKTWRRVDRYQIGLAGGSISGSVRGEPISSTTDSVVWRGRVLEIRHGQYSGSAAESGTYSEHGEDWSLDGKNGLIVVTTDRGSETGTRRSTATYRRQGSSPQRRYNGVAQGFSPARG